MKKKDIAGTQPCNVLFLWLTGLPMSGVLDRIPENLRGPTDALLIRMGVHPKGNRFVAVSQSLGHAGDVGAAGDGHAGEGVPELVGVQIRDAVPLGEFPQIPGGTLWVHRLCRPILCKYPLADALLGLFGLELP